MPRCSFAIVLWMGWLVAPAHPAEPARATTDEPVRLPAPAWRADARLYDVVFVDAEHGWACGDRGTIWNTVDGGRRWQLQESGVACPLYSLWFFDAQNGLAAGGATTAYQHASRGVLLSTTDGGLHWQPVPSVMLPTVKLLRFNTPRQGWALTDATALFPSGVFISESGGRAWQPLPGGHLASWSAGALIDAGAGVVAGRTGTLAMVRRGSVEPPAFGSLGLAGIARIRLVPPRYGWLAGEGGLLRFTDDLGQQWRAAPGDFPEQLARHIDFAALAARGPRCWLAGSPGSRLLRTMNGGQSWEAIPTGQPLPIHAIAMLDDNRGWAVGELGTILTTADGGSTWQRQRGPAERVALLGVFADFDSIPLEAFARFAGDEGYLSAIEVLGRRDIEFRRGGAADPTDRLHEAALAVGASSGHRAWQFPLRQPGLRLSAEQVLDGWDSANGGHGREMLEATLVKLLRMWRPEVVLTAQPEGGDDTAADDLVMKAVQSAVIKAADPAAYAWQQSELGLVPWQAKKLYAASDAAREAVDLSSARLAPRLGKSLAEAAAPARALLAERFTPAPQHIGFRALLQTGSESPRDDLLTGVLLSPGGDARREYLEPAAERVEFLTRMAQRRRNAQAILEQTSGHAPSNLSLLTQTCQLARQFDADDGAWLVFNLAQHYATHGQWPMAAEAFGVVVQQYPQNTLFPASALWLLHYLASGEAAWREQAAAAKGPSGLAAPQGTLGNAARLKRAVALAQQIEQTRPDLYAEPALRFALAATLRGLGDPRQAEQLYTSAARTSARDGWHDTADAEQWLRDRKGNCPKPLVRCAAATARPKLDGKLDEPIWQAAAATPLASAQRDDGQWPASIRFARDADFLYLAIECRSAPGLDYAVATGARRRDADLTSHDRVEVLLDINRDYATWWRLAVDHRGWTADDCTFDRTWDPNWFVAADRPAGGWLIEAAVPWTTLAPQAPAAGDVWALGVQRIVPGVGFQSINQPAATSILPAGFGLLLFE